MIDIGSLNALRSVAAVGAIGRAADELGFTASAVSQQIKRLERQVGVALLAPAGRGVVLTPAGHALLDAAPAVFQSLERCAEAARSAADGMPAGDLRVTAFSTAIRGLLAPLLPRLATAHPNLRLRVTEQDPGQALHSVVAGTADLAIVHDADGIAPPLPAALIRQDVHTDVGDLVMHRAHPLAAALSPLASAQVAGQAWVTSPPGSVCHQWFRRLVADHPAEPDVQHLVDDFATQLALVSTGTVIALMPRLARPPLGADLTTRRLAPAPTRQVFAAWRRSADASPAIRAVLAALARAQP